LALCVDMDVPVERRLGKEPRDPQMKDPKNGDPRKWG